MPNDCTASMPLRVLHLSTADNFGGSGRSAYKLHSGLRELGVDSKMLVGIKVTSDPDVELVAQRWRKLGDHLAAQLLNRLGLQYQYLFSSARLHRHPWVQQADVIQLYNTHGDYLSHPALPRLAGGRPVVWRLSDMWPLTGHCAYSGDCERWRHGCGHCPDLATYPPLARDTTAMLWRQKQRLYRRLRLHFVAPSSWTKQLLDASPLSTAFENSLIPNGINPAIFRPVDKSWCRRFLNLPTDRDLVLFSAHVLTNNARKGGELFLEAIRRLPAAQLRRTTVMLVGEGAANFGRDLPCPVWRHDFVRDDEMLALLYNAADVYVHAAVLENFPNAIVEAMACAVPAVAFDSGGVRDLVLPGQTGCLAPVGDAMALSAGLARLLDDPALRQQLGQNGLHRVSQRHTLAQQAQAFLALYQRLRCQ